MRKNKMYIYFRQFGTPSKGKFDRSIQFNLNSVGARLLAKEQGYSLCFNEEEQYLYIAPVESGGSHIGYFKSTSLPRISFRNTPIGLKILQLYNERPVRMYGSVVEGELRFYLSDVEVL